MVWTTEWNEKSGELAGLLNPNFVLNGKAELAYTHQLQIMVVIATRGMDLRTKGRRV